MKNILLISDDKEMIESFKNYFMDNSFFNLYINNNLLEVNLDNYHIIIIDFFLKEMDGYDILMGLKSNIKKVVIIPYYLLDMMALLEHFKINYVITKPVYLIYLEEKLRKLCNCDVVVINLLTYEATNFLEHIGITKKLQGTKYLLDIPELVINERYDIDHKLYDVIAEKHHDDPKNIARCIRYAIDKSLARMSYDDKLDLYGSLINYRNGSVYNFDFISVFVDKVKYMINKKN